DRLAPGGTVVVNVGHPPGNDDLESVIGRTMASVFPSVLRDRFDDTNTLLLGSQAPASPRRLGAFINDLPARLRSVAEPEARRLGPPLAGGTIYTDDRAPVEWLVDRSILGYASR